MISGIAGRYKLHLNGSRRIVSFALPGDLCDVQGLDTGFRELHLRALTPCTVASIPRQALVDLIEVHPGIARAMGRAGTDRLSIACEWLVNDSRAAEKRAAHLFCELLARLHAVGLARENSIELKLTQVDLAEALGISFVHVNRVLQSLRSHGLIELQRHVLSVRNVARLQAFAEFDASYLHLTGGHSELAARGLQQRLVADWSHAIGSAATAKPATLKLIRLRQCGGRMWISAQPRRSGFEAHDMYGLARAVTHDNTRLSVGVALRLVGDDLAQSAQGFSSDGSLIRELCSLIGRQRDFVIIEVKEIQRHYKPHLSDCVGLYLLQAIHYAALPSKNGQISRQHWDIPCRLQGRGWFPVR